MEAMGALHKDVNKLTSGFFKKRNESDANIVAENATDASDLIQNKKI